MDSEKLLAIGGAALSLGFTYIPGLNSWYDGLSKEYKQLVMLGILLVVTLAVFGLSCAGILDAVTCDKGGAVSIAFAFIAALTANQATHRITPKTNKADD